jgi:hypothetical protein
MSTPLNKDIEMDNVQTNMEKLNTKDNSNDLTTTFDNMSLKTNYGNDKSMNNSLFSSDLFSPFKSNSLNVTKTPSFDDSMKTLNVNKIDSSGHQGNIFTEPDSVKDINKEVEVEPPRWNYKDPSGKIQGPFLYEEMQEWYNAGYFEKNLPVKKENEAEFKSLSSIIEQYGEEKPFIIEAEKYIKKEKELNLKANEVSAASAAVQPSITSTNTSSKPTIKPIQKTTSSSHQTSLNAKVTSPIGNKTMPLSSYSVGGIGLGRGIGMNENNSFNNNLDSMYNSFNNNTINSPKVYNNRNASYPTMGNQYEHVGYPGMNRLSTNINNPQMMGIPGNQPWVSYNDPSLFGLKGMIGFNDIYSNQYYNYELMNPDLNKSNFNQQFYYQQLMQQQTQQFPPQYYQMMRQMPQNQIPLYNMFGQPINTIGMKPQIISNSNIGSIQNEIIPPMNNSTTTKGNSQSLFSGNNANQNSTQNTSKSIWNNTLQSTDDNNNINDNKTEKNEKTDSVSNVDSSNDEITNQSLNKENTDNTQLENLTNDIPINEANTELKDNIEEIKESEPEQNEEPETEIINEETQEENENEEELVEEIQEEESEKKEELIKEDEKKNEKEEDEVEGDEKIKEEENEKEEIKEEVKEEIKKPISPTPAPIKNHWKISASKTHSLSIKEIQELEEKEKLEQLKKHQQEMKEKQEAAAKAAAEASANVNESSQISHSETTTVWGAPHNIQKPTLRQIMQEEENNKKKQKDLQMKEAESKKNNKATTHVVVNTTRSVWAGRPLTIIADSNSKVVTASSLNATKKESIKKEIISSSTSRSQPNQVNTSVTNTPTTAKSENEWTSIGKNNKKNEQPSRKITKSSSKIDNSNKGPSDAFMKWCKNALRVSTSAGVNVDEFVNVLLLMPLNETSVIYDICNDTLGGITAIDPLKFAEEFIKRRKMDQNDQSFSAVRGYNSYIHDDNKNSNKFIPVKGNGRKKNRQNIN